jgi:hypothetical protein
MGLLPAGGVTWDYIQYVLGFKALGHDVWYVEDTGLWPIYQEVPATGVSCLTNVTYLAGIMRDFGIADRWAYRDEVTGEWFGQSRARAEQLISSAEMLVNISCANVSRDEYSVVPIRVLVDSDPMFTQIQHRDSMAFFPGTPGMRATIASHTHHFSFGELIEGGNTRVPECGVNWLPTRQPICTSLWPRHAIPGGRPRFSTVMNWTASRKFDYDGESWGQKDVEFRKLVDLPAGVPPVSLAVAVTQTKRGSDPFPAREIRDAGWELSDPNDVAATWRSYQNFIQGSTGEFSVAKEAYVKGHTGWFSCRSACYLASGRPVVTQDTGWSEVIPTGRGLFSFCDMESAIEAIEEVRTDPSLHARAAAEIADEYFESGKVLSSLIERATT